MRVTFYRGLVGAKGLERESVLMICFISKGEQSLPPVGHEALISICLGFAASVFGR